MHHIIPSCSSNAMPLLSRVQVKKERSALVQGEKLKMKNGNSQLTAPQRPQRFRPTATAAVSPYSPSRNADGSSFSKDEDNSSFISTTGASSSFGSGRHHRRGDNSPSRSRRTPRLSRAGSGNPVLEGEAQRLEALKRRRFMELQQMLSFQLRSLAREVKQAVYRATITVGRTSSFPGVCVCARARRVYLVQKISACLAYGRAVVR